MIIVKLWGGLGNQLFQYAFGFCLSKKYNDELLFDIDFYNKQPSHVGKREVKIDKYFNLTNFNTTSRPEELLFWENRIVNKGIRLFPKFYTPWFHNYFFVKEKPGIFMKMVPYRFAKNNYYDGYWQTSLYFDTYKEELKKEFTLKESIGKEISLVNHISNNQNTVAVHVRRGDLIKKRNLPHGFTEERLIKYYDDAISYITKVVDAAHFVFISDDIEWCKKRWNDMPNSTFLDNYSHLAEIVDLMSISNCKHGIMSPSSFSWWGNWLRDNKAGSVVVIPSGEFGNTFFAEKEWVKL